MFKHTHSKSHVQSPGKADLGGDPWENVATECTSIARELLDLLNRETGILKRFDSKELLELLPSKEQLVMELQENLKKLHNLRNSPTKAGNPSILAALNQSLTEVRKANHLNHLFAQGSLDYWQGLTALFRPPTYGPVQAMGSRKDLLAPKGLSFSKEI